MDLSIDDDFKQSWFSPWLEDLDTNEETEITDCPTFKSCKTPKSAKSASFKLSAKAPRRSMFPHDSPPSSIRDATECAFVMMLLLGTTGKKKRCV
eukprot:scaffold215654_cov39-Attheya_sp.AAC.1